MMWNRAQINIHDRQTDIFFRDLASCGSYGYLNLDPRIINDDVWIQSCVSAINVLKTNDEFGYKFLDMTQEYKKYKTARRK